jgi:hypothetical protein
VHARVGLFGRLDQVAALGVRVEIQLARIRELCFGLRRRGLRGSG